MTVDTVDFGRSVSTPVQKKLHFGGNNFKKLVKDFKKLDASQLPPDARKPQTEALALNLFAQCKTKQALLDFAKPAGIVIHAVEPNTPLDAYMLESYAQGLAIYPLSKTEGLSPEAKERFQPTEARAGLELLTECEAQKKPLVLIRPSPNDPEFELYVLKHELFHILQQTAGIYGKSASNYENEALASSYHIGLLKKLHNANSFEARDIKSKADQNKAPTDSGDAHDTFGQALRQVSSLDLQTYEFFCENAKPLGLSKRITEHNEKLRDIYETIKRYSYTPEYNLGLKSAPMIRS